MDLRGRHGGTAPLRATDLEAGAAADIVVTGISSGGGLLSGTASVSSTTHDPVAGNNIRRR
jgi:hypothetical protein